LALWRYSGTRRLLADLGQIGLGDMATVAPSCPVCANGMANPGPHSTRRAHMTSRGPERPTRRALSIARRSLQMAHEACVLMPLSRQTGHVVWARA